MNNLQEAINLLKIYAEIADDYGDYKTADKCYQLLREAESLSNSNIKTAAVKLAFFKKIFRGIKNIGKAIDRTVRKIIPGGWATVLTAVAAPYLSKLPVKMKGIGGKVLNFVKSGGDPMTLLNNANPMVQQAAQMFISQAQQAKQTQGFSAQPPSMQEQWAAGMQAGASPTMQGTLPIMGYQQQQQNQSSYQPYYSVEAQVYNVFNDTSNKLKSANAQTAPAIINEYKTKMQQLSNQAMQQTNVPGGQKQTPETVLMIPTYNDLLKRNYPQFSNLIS